MERLLDWLPAGLALVGTGIAWGLLRGKLEALEKRLDEVQRELHEVRRHLGDVKNDVGVLKDRAHRGDRP